MTNSLRTGIDGPFIVDLPINSMVIFNSYIK